MCAFIMSVPTHEKGAAQDQNSVATIRHRPPPVRRSVRVRSCPGRGGDEPGRVKKRRSRAEGEGTSGGRAGRVGPGLGMEGV